MPRARSTICSSTRDSAARRWRFNLLQRYTGPDHADILRGHLRDAEHWLAETLQSHLSHPVLSFYRAQHWGKSWLVSVATIMDCCALVIVCGKGLPAAQARLTFQMGTRLLEDLTHALAVRVDSHCPPRLTEADIPAIAAALQAAGLAVNSTQRRCRNCWSSRESMISI